MSWPEVTSGVRLFKKEKMESGGKGVRKVELVGWLIVGWAEAPSAFSLPQQ